MGARSSVQSCSCYCCRCPCCFNFVIFLILFFGPVFSTMSSLKRTFALGMQLHRRCGVPFRLKNNHVSIFWWKRGTSDLGRRPDPSLQACFYDTQLDLESDSADQILLLHTPSFWLSFRLFGALLEVAVAVGIATYGTLSDRQIHPRDFGEGVPFRKMTLSRQGYVDYPLTPLCRGCCCAIEGE